MQEQHPYIGTERAVGSQLGAPSTSDTLSLRCVLMFKFGTQGETESESVSHLVMSDSL